MFRHFNPVLMSWYRRLRILDDGAARKCARSFGLSIKGTLAIVLLAKQHGIISSAAQVIRALQTVGLHLNDDLIRQALWRTVGESWDY